MGKEDKRISVVVPIYNVEKYIQKCLDSIRRQTYTDLEVIMVNDGSTDDSGCIAQRFALQDERFMYLEKENEGLSAARNEGMLRASGEWIVFVDSDDWMKETYLADMVAEFEESVDIVIGKYTAADQIAGKIYVPFASETITSVFLGEEKEREIIERHLNAYPGTGFLIKDTLMPVWKNMYRRDLLRSNAILFVSEKNVGTEDYVFNFEAYYAAGQIKVSAVTGYVHRIGSDSLSQKYYPDALERSLCRRDYIAASVNEKTFYHKDRIKKAVADESSRMVLWCVYGICKADIREKRRKITEIMRNPSVMAIMKENKRPNLSRGYIGIFYMLKYFGIRIACGILSAAGKQYSIYRRLQYIQRK